MLRRKRSTPRGTARRTALVLRRKRSTLSGSARRPARRAPTSRRGGAAFAPRHPQHTPAPLPPCSPAPPRTLARLLGFLAPVWPWVTLSVLLGVLTIGSSVGLLAASAWIISAAALRPPIAELQVAIVGVRFFGIARGVFRYLERLVSHHTTFRILAGLRVRFYAALEPLAPGRLPGSHSGDLLSRIVADIGTLEGFYLRAAAPVCVAALTAAGMAVFMGSYDWRLAAAAVGLLLVAGPGLAAVLQVLGRGPGRGLAAARGALNAALVDGIQGAADLAAFDAGRDHVSRVCGLSEALARGQTRMAALGGLNAALNAALAQAAVIAVLAIAIPLVSQGRLDGVHLGVLVLAAAASFEAALPLPAAAQHLENSLAAGRRLFEIAGADQGEPGHPRSRSPGGGIAPGKQLPMSHPEPVGPEPSISAGSQRRISWSGPSEEESAAAAGGSRSKEAPPALVFTGVSVRYAPDEPLALDRVSFTVPAGRCTAIVGASGAGKSTLVNALLRFTEYETGEIILAGRELRQMTPEEVRSRLAVVTQHTHLFNATIRDNLLLARRAAAQHELEAACRRAQVHDFIAAQPAGYDTWIGEGGLRLSGGERQRLALARALLADAALLVLDEPTAHLDPLTEQAVLADLLAGAAGRTVLIITHRLVGLEATDEIIVLDGGRVVELGSHRTLLAARGPYARFWLAQSTDA